MRTFPLPILSLLLNLALISSVCSTSFIPFLNFTSPSPYIFHSIATLLQTYPQNLFPNGHTIASVTIPRHTLLYHGRHDNDTVPSPEWLALDIEMAYGIMGSMPDSRMLTYRTTKDIKAVYFDGASANLVGDGTLSQMVLLYNGSENIPRRGDWGPPPGKERGHRNDSKNGDDRPRRPPVRWNPLEDEYTRARGLCKWLFSRGLGGNGWGYEGIVRMNAGFEVIWCDFDSPSLQLLSNLNVSAPRLDIPTQVHAIRGDIFQAQARLRGNNDEGPHGPWMTDPREPFRDTANWHWFSAAAKRYFGDSRIRVNRCGLFSFYESRLFNQTHSRISEEMSRLNLTEGGRWLAPDDESARKSGLQQLTRRRRQHTLKNVANKDGLYMRQAIESRLRNVLRGEDGCNSIDWHNVAEEIAIQYSADVKSLLQILIRGIGDPSRECLRSTRALTHRFLLPFLEYPPDRPYDKAVLKVMFGPESPVSLAALERCQHQYLIEENEMGEEDTMVYSAVQETLAGLCGTIIEIGLGVEYLWLLNFNSEPLDEDGPGAEVQSEIVIAARLWIRKLEELMAWLGWAERWSGCADLCDTGEVCYIPMWPVSGFPRRSRAPPPQANREDHLYGFAVQHWGWGDMNKYLWEPVCVNSSNYPPEEWE
ncbi:hypothetical protein BCR34DRAFT_58133 [Clohesyomyces aquaticus]|uniref:Uncharacterized protein n=1 Tax=Clohesyomyces aquaticus TaxID=1231657 RepID=A0A1Y1Z292_9PLEO|nr:hypothetical protein BCR34DRAFT_58133 [Clohesyomyces aquaticus]